MTTQKFFFQIIILLSIGLQVSCVKLESLETKRQHFTLDTSTISAIQLDMPATVNVRQGIKQSIEIYAQPEIFEAMNKSVSNEEWIINTTGSFVFESITIDITLEHLTALRATSTGDIFVKNTFDNLEELFLEIDGTGDINFKGSAEAIIAQLNGTGIIQLAGTADILEINSDGTTELLGYDLAVKEASIETNSTSNVEIQVQNSLQVTIDGMGDVFYRGTPTIESTISGLGELINAN